MSLSCFFVCSNLCVQATEIVQEKLIMEDKRPRITDEQKRVEVEGILNLILPCNAVLHVAFPIHRCRTICMCWSHKCVEHVNHELRVKFTFCHILVSCVK